MRPRWMVGFALVVLAVLLAFWVLEQNPSSAARADHYYTGAYPERPENLNPFTTTQQLARRVLRYTHDALMGWDPETGDLRPALAQSWEAMDDEVTFQFTLREGVRFADGSPVTMEDLLFTFEVCSDDSVPLGSMGSDLSRVRAAMILPGPPEILEVVLEEPHFAGLEAFAPEWTVVQKKYYLGEVQRLALASGRVVPVPGAEGFGELLEAVKLPGPGTGAYQLEEGVRSGRLPWASLRDLRLVSNPDSWHRRVCGDCWQLAGFQWLFISDAGARLIDLLKHELDWYGVADAEALFERYPHLAEAYTHHVYDYRNLGHYWVVWNLRREKLRDARVRQALSMLFNREVIVQDVLNGNGTMGISYFKPETPYLEPKTAYYPGGEPVPFDPQGARALLEQAGFDPVSNPLRIEIVELQGDPFYRRVLDLAQDAFGAAGVTLERRPLEFSAMLQVRRERDFDGLIYLYNHGSFVDPYPDFHSSQRGEHGQNHAGYRNEDVDWFLEEARRQMDGERRSELYRRVDAIIRRDQPVTFLAHPWASMLINSDIEGVKPGPLGLVPERWRVR